MPARHAGAIKPADQAGWVGQKFVENRGRGPENKLHFNWNPRHKDLLFFLARALRNKVELFYLSKNMNFF